MPETVTLALTRASATDVFDPSVEGVEPITDSGTPVSADLVKAVRKKARENGVRLRVVRNDQR